MRLFARTRRAMRIASVAARYRLDLLANLEGMPFTVRAALLPAKLFPVRNRERGERLRLALQDLGPVFVKFGQVLSTRPDLIPADIATELNLLQDQVAPFDSAKAVAIIEQAFGANIGDIFEHFDEAPMASASIAQVHTAVLCLDKPLAHDPSSPDPPQELNSNTVEVVVKIVRPDIEATIADDISLMHSVAKLVERFVPDGHRLRPVDVVAEYQHVIGDELNMQLEAANTSQLRRNFENSDLLYVPEVYWDFVRPNVLVMERIYGIPITNIDELHAHNTNMKELAERGVEIFFSQVFRDSFFHADMHPGNIFVDVSNPDKPKYIGIDCAIIGSLDETDLYYLARNLLAIFQRDYRTVAEMHVESGWVPKHIRATDFESAIRSVCEPIFQKPLSEISFGQILLYLFTVARRFEMSVQPNLVLLQKTLLAVEGLGRQLYPQLDLWQTAQPFLEDWMAKRYAPAQVLQRMQKQAPSLLLQLPQLPDLLIDNLKQASGLREAAAAQQLHLADLQQQGRRRERRQKIVAAALIALAATMAIAPESLMLTEHDLSALPLLLGTMGIALLLG
ncbi:MAG: ubiquinone biosynthesis regulatory protein kinase UbiB [Pseudomonadales bacterium]